MKRQLLVLMVILTSCSSSRNNNGNSVEEPVKQVSKPLDQDVPACIQKMIGQFKAEEKQNPPREIISYTFRGNTVFYVTPPCCDFFSDLYDTACVHIGHPDGGFTGRGDGGIINFRDSISNEKLIWRDERK